MSEDAHIASIKLWAFGEALKTDKQNYIHGNQLKQPMMIDLACKTLVPHIGNWALMLTNFGVICEIGETPKRLYCDHDLSINIVKKIFSKKNLKSYISGGEEHVKFDCLIASLSNDATSKNASLPSQLVQNHSNEGPLFTRKSDNLPSLAASQACDVQRQNGFFDFASLAPQNWDTKNSTKSENDLCDLIYIDRNINEDSSIKDSSQGGTLDQFTKDRQYNESLINIQLNAELLLSQLDESSQPEEVDHVQNIKKRSLTVPSVVTLDQDSDSINVNKSEWDIYLQKECELNKASNIFKCDNFTYVASSSPVPGSRRNIQISHLRPFYLNVLIKNLPIIFSWLVLSWVLLLVYFYILTLPLFAIYCVFSFFFATALIFISKQVVLVHTRENLSLRNSIPLRDFLTQHFTTRQLKKLINKENIILFINKTGRTCLPSSDVVRLWPGDIVLIKKLGVSFEVTVGLGTAKKLLTFHEIEEIRLRWLAEHKAKLKGTLKKAVSARFRRS
ncbi:MAG: hypothetical protein HQ457_10730 [Betaproteobacteria bacterium]|nr:hypothetical protein [Betaproteobacteria bacterium]